MLLQLTINNFAIIKHLVIDFNDKMTVITGETGAGKSIAIDALAMCLGYRSEASMIKNNAKQADISATFAVTKSSLAFDWLEKHALIDEENPTECILRRTINIDGRSKGFINNCSVPIAQLRALGQYLIHLNGQHAPQLLLKNEYQLELLDNYAGLQNMKMQMKHFFEEWKNLQTQLKNFYQTTKENQALKQLLQYQVEELDQFATYEGEFSKLEEEHFKLSNCEKLTQLSQSVLGLLKDKDENAENLIYKALKDVDHLQTVEPNYKAVTEMLQDALIGVQEASSLIERLASEIEDDPKYLELVESRLAKFISLSRKHSVKAEDLFQQHQKLSNQLKELLNLDLNEEELLAKEKQAWLKCVNCAKEISQKRLEASKKLSLEVTEQIQNLSMIESKFFIEVNFDENKLNASGADAVEFNLCSNVGETMRPLAKIASGGELSRISLAVQVLTANKLATPTIIFDEVDAGISGIAATNVGKLLRTLGKNCQVICITHLPQVASFGNSHFWVQKTVNNNQTEINIAELSAEQRIQSLAQLLGGSTITQSIPAAKEMLQQAQAYDC